MSAVSWVTLNKCLAGLKMTRWYGHSLAGTTPGYNHTPSHTPNTLSPGQECDCTGRKSSLSLELLAVSKMTLSIEQWLYLSINKEKRQKNLKRRTLTLKSIQQYCAEFSFYNQPIHEATAKGKPSPPTETTETRFSFTSVSRGQLCFHVFFPPPGVGLEPQVSLQAS